MTSNQINFWNYHEGARHNVVTEREAKRHNKALEGIERSKIALGYAQLAEQAVRNQNDFIVGVQQAENSAQQAAASTKQAEVADYRARREDSRAQMSIIETQRHNEALEAVQSESNLIRRDELEQRKSEFIIDTIRGVLLGRGNIFDAIEKAKDVFTYQDEAQELMGLISSLG